MTAVVNAIGSATLATVYLATGGGLLACLVLTLAATAACAAGLPLPPSRGAELH
jgi:hypothetical protein